MAGQNKLSAASSRAKEVKQGVDDAIIKKFHALLENCEKNKAGLYYQVAEKFNLEEKSSRYFSKKPSWLLKLAVGLFNDSGHLPRQRDRNWKHEEPWVQSWA